MAGPRVVATVVAAAAVVPAAASPARGAAMVVAGVVSPRLGPAVPPVDLARGDIAAGHDTRLAGGGVAMARGRRLRRARLVPAGERVAHRRRAGDERAGGQHDGARLQGRGGGARTAGAGRDLRDAVGAKAL